jgi:hypothetical protein
MLKVCLQDEKNASSTYCLKQKYASYMHLHCNSIVFHLKTTRNTIKDCTMSRYGGYIPISNRRSLRANRVRTIPVNNRRLSVWPVRGTQMSFFSWMNEKYWPPGSPSLCIYNYLIWLQDEVGERVTCTFSCMYKLIKQARDVAM